jgi:hypothetical protein
VIEDKPLYVMMDTNTERIMLNKLEMFFIDHLKLALLPMREVLLS